ALAARLPGSAAPALPFPAALAVEVDDLSRTAAVLDDNQVAYRRAGGQLTVAARDAGGAAVIFCANAEAAFAGAPEEP
ncbi:VOC family protein, partial [Bordetella bronchiseptica]